MNFRDEMVKFVPICPQRILEIGCAEGNFASHFPETEYWGVEPCQTAATEAKHKLSHILIGTYEYCEGKIPNNYFDVIICNDVIEHLVDPRQFLLSIKQKLQPKGVLVASVPNLRNAVDLFNLLIKGDFHYADSGILDYTHLHLFTPKSFCQMAHDCNWAVETCAPINPLPFKPLKRVVLTVLKKFISEIDCTQFAVTMRPL